MSSAVPLSASSSPAWCAAPKTPSAPACLCGTVLAAVTGYWLCGHCGRAFCRDCGGVVARMGGCDICTVCGAGSCG